MREGAANFERFWERQERGEKSPKGPRARTIRLTHKERKRGDKQERWLSRGTPAPQELTGRKEEG